MLVATEVRAAFWAGAKAHAEATREARIAVFIIFIIGIIILCIYKEFVGDFRNGSFDLGWDTFDEETQIRKRGIELNQGRAAMMGILALMVHEQLGVSLLPAV